MLPLAPFKLAEPFAAAADTLAAGRARRLVLRRGEAVVVREGRLWLTREGDPHDHVLTPGAGYVATVPQDVVIEVLGGPRCRYERHRLR